MAAGLPQALPLISQLCHRQRHIAPKRIASDQSEDVLDRLIILVYNLIILVFAVFRRDVEEGSSLFQTTQM